MITNKDITYYSKGIDNTTRLEVWDRVVFEDVWVFGGKGSNINDGYENSNDVNVRIPMERVESAATQPSFSFKIGDIVAVGIQGNIEKQSDLNGIEFYNVTSVNVNDFGNNKHIHLKGR